MASLVKQVKGFSLIELTAVLVVLGIVVAMAAPRMDSGSAIRELSYADQLLADLRFAQQRAEADGCDIRISIASTSVTIRQRAALCSGAFNRSVARLDAAGSTIGETPPDGVGMDASPAVFYFDSAGRALDSVGGTPTDVTITVGARQLDITGATGYARF